MINQCKTLLLILSKFRYKKSLNYRFRGCVRFRAYSTAFLYPTLIGTVGIQCVIFGIGAHKTSGNNDDAIPQNHNKGRNGLAKVCGWRNIAIANRC